VSVESLDVDELEIQEVTQSDDEPLPEEYQPIEPVVVPAKALLTDSRIIVNYTLIPIVFLVLGIVIGAIGYDRLVVVNRSENETLVQNAVAAALDGQEQRIADTVVSALSDQLESAGQVAQDGPNLNERQDVDVDDDPALGPEDAPIVIVEFSDYRCPYCGRFARETLGPLLETYEGQIRFVFRDFPILGPDSTVAALASECADDQGAFWAYHDLMFAHQAELAREMLIGLAGDLQLDVDAFTICLDEQIHHPEITADYAAAQKFGARGTPTFYINGRYLSGAKPFEEFAAIIVE